MKRALIITPTGCPYYSHSNYDCSNNHWTFRSPNKTFDTCAVVFNDYVPEQHQFDRIIFHKGRKWSMLPEVARMVNWEDYDYIGYWDDDYATDIASIERALDLAQEYDMRLFQQSLTSWTVYPILEHKPNYVFSETNFIELGVPFFRNDIFRKVLGFFQDYKPGNAEWGMDKVLCYYLQCTAHVIHDSTVHHCRQESSYSKEEGFKEMDYLMREWFPKYMKEKFNLDYKYFDQQLEFSALRKPIA